MKSFTMLCLMAGVMFLTKGLFAQDIHFSQFGSAPLQMNPAFTGAFGGEARLVANYRNQWETIPVPYNTYAFSVDSKIQTSRSHNYFGVGLSLYSDKAGDLDFETNSYMLTMAYNMFLGSVNRRHGDIYLRMGFNGGQIRQGFDYTNIHLENPGQETYVNPEIKYLDYGLGAVLSYVEPLYMVYGGLSFSHFHQPDVSFYNQPGLEPVKPGSSQGEALFQKLNLQLGGDFSLLNNQISLLPELLFSKQFVHRELVAGTYVRFNNLKIKKARHSDVWHWNLGAWYRWNDAFIVGTKWDYSNILSIGLSYDWNVSLASEATNGYGALELSLVYTIQSPRTKNAPSHSGGIRQKVKCPKISAGPFYENPWYRQRGLQR